MVKEALTLEDIHRETLVIVEKINEICEELNINSYLAYGTLLGAVRHKGFIPWDDDYDIFMLRPDYDKFLAYCEEHAEELKPFRLMNYHNTERYTFAISRFCDLRYEMVMEDGNEVGMGMFIDVYPFDGLGNSVSEWKRKYLSLKNKWLSMGVYYSNSDNTVPNMGNAVKKMGRKAFCLYARMFGTSYFIKKLEEMAQKHSVDESKYVGIVVWEEVKVFPKEWMEECVYLEFEGIKVKAPKHYKEMLELWYGDYMQLPPVEQRIPHHMYKLYRK